jgi:tRNA dimethylallyltransferase
MPKSLIILLGPTGVGKTSLSTGIAEHFATEIISCDSRQIFREMSIGTAVPDQITLDKVKHHFIQSHSIHDYYNASKYEIEVLAELDSLFKNYDVVVMTGGSMLYIDAVCKGIDDLPEVDTELRDSLIKRMQNEGIESLRNELRFLDPVYYAEVDLRNPKRILHAMEICLMTGKPYSSFRINQPKTRNFNLVKIGLNRERSVLYDRINLRVEEMFREGLVEEARNLYPYRHLNSLNTVGYRELFDYFDNNISLEEAKEKIKTNSHKYARKQLTWFARDPTINWFSPPIENDILTFLDLQLKEK